MSSIYQCSVHNHCLYCDGSDSAENMARAAYEAGVRYFGLSCHSHTAIPHDEGNVLRRDYGYYFAALKRLRQLYEGKMEILFGIEQDSLSDVPPLGFDYVIGSVHNLRGSRFYCLDWSRDELRECMQQMFSGDGEALFREYYRQVAAALEKEPDILGHIDLITKLNGDGEFFDEESESYRSAALEALEAAHPDRTLLEINTGAVSRGYRSSPYPAPFILRRWKQLGGQVIITSDAHRRENIIFGYDMAAELARSAGYRECALLTGGGIELCRL